MSALLRHTFHGSTHLGRMSPLRTRIVTAGYSRSRFLPQPPIFYYRQHFDAARTHLNFLSCFGFVGALLSRPTLYTSTRTHIVTSEGLFWLWLGNKAFVTGVLISVGWTIFLTCTFPDSHGAGYRRLIGVWIALAAGAACACAGAVLLILALTETTASRWAYSADACIVLAVAAALAVVSAILYNLARRQPTTLVHGPLCRLAPAASHDPDDSAALSFLQTYDAYGGALQYLRRRSIRWGSANPDVQARLLMETIECFRFDTEAAWMNAERSLADFEKFVRQAPRWIDAVEDLRASNRQVPAVSARQIRRLNQIVQELGGYKLSRRSQSSAGTSG